jgi:signal peptidase I
MFSFIDHFLHLLMGIATGRFVVQGLSMEPTLNDGQRLLISRFRSHRPFKRGDIVAVNGLDDTKLDYIKRIIGLPGEHVLIRNSEVLIDGSYLKEAYLKDDESPKNGLVSEWTLMDGEYIVFGDNRNHSNDSRKFGSVLDRNILGIAWFRYWPISMWGKIP